MKKYISIVFVLLAALLLALFSSCVNDDDYYEEDETSQEWKDYQATIIQKALDAVDKDGNKIYDKVITSSSGLGKVYSRSSDYITNTMENPTLKPQKPDAFTRSTTKATRPNRISDQLEIRYEGWYYYEEDEEDKIYTFDTTQNTNGVPNEGKTIIRLDATSNNIRTYIDGFITAILDMEIGEERIFCIPYTLGYGTIEYSSGGVTIPGYTTLFFDIKLLRNITIEKELEKE